ncbi:nuclease domain-containing protein, partial [Romboutsia sp. 13368]|uniref:nuclease domain-containing protein n=1 Tax=Romboutsia sp. 13368 TaxID=2708053 RepID=UPI0025E77EA7
YYYLLLSKGLDISSGLYDISNKKLWNLYEIWCYIKIHSIIKELGYEAKENSIIQSTSNGLTLSLMQNKEAKCIYENEQGKRLELFYNKQYNKLPTTNQRPDTVLCLKGVGKTDRVYIFDAKYRIYVDNNGNICPMEDDINIMHRYRDSIVSKNKLDNQFKYESIGAYVMFPCSDEESFKENRFYKSIDKVNIGALPMLPGSTSLMKKHLCSIINESYIEAVNNNPVFDEENDYYKFKNKNVMIVNTKDKDHFDIYKKHRFYHIPKSSISKIDLGIEYLAFYQPKDKPKSINRFDSNYGIEYYAKIKDYYEYERKSCSEIKCTSGKENDIYIRIELDDFEKVGPIKRIEYGTRIVNYTTLYLLKNANTMHELYLGSRKEIDIYKILRKISEDKNISLKKENNGFYIGSDFVKILENGDIKLNGNKINIDEIMKYYQYK